MVHCVQLDDGGTVEEESTAEHQSPQAAVIMIDGAAFTVRGAEADGLPMRKSIDRKGKTASAWRKLFGSL